MRRRPPRTGGGAPRPGPRHDVAAMLRRLPSTPLEMLKTRR
uniref:Uncharacterized protein n=1 Tax=Setaria italica TaxID=4555 RepID=K3ZG26_SETIT